MAAAGPRRRGLEQQGGLADPGLSGEQQHGARDEAAAEHAVELVDAAWARRARTAIVDARRCGRRACGSTVATVVRARAAPDLLDGAPGLALAAAADPLGRRSSRSRCSGTGLPAPRAMAATSGSAGCGERPRSNRFCSSRWVPGAAQSGQLVVGRLPDEGDDLVAAGLEDRLGADVRVGVGRAVPREVVAARAPVAALVLAEHDDELLGAVLVLRAVLVRAAQRQLPADLGLGLDEGDALGIGEVVQCAAVAAGEVGGVVEDAGALDDAGLLARRPPSPSSPSWAGVVVLPLLGRQLLDPGGDALAVLLLGEVRAVHAAAGVGPRGVDALAAAAEDAGPARRQPGEVGLDEVARVGRVDELDPLTREVQGSPRAWRQPTWLAVTRRPMSMPMVRRRRASDSFDPVRLGVLDLGSNTVHLLLGRRPLRRCAGARVQAEDAAATVGAPAGSDGSVDEAAVDQLVDFVERGQKLAEDKGATEIMAFATSAIREAANGEDVLRRLHASPASTSRCCRARTRPA